VGQAFVPAAAFHAARMWHTSDQSHHAFSQLRAA